MPHPNFTVSCNHCHRRLLQLRITQKTPHVWRSGGGGGATWPLPRDGVVEESHEDLTVGPRPKVPVVKNGSGAEDGAPERLGCGTGELHQRLAASTWWCGSRPSIREVGQNGETTTPRGPVIRLPPIVWRSRIDWRRYPLPFRCRRRRCSRGLQKMLIPFFSCLVNWPNLL